MMTMHSPAHPGVILRDFMAAATVGELAAHLRVTRPALSAILNGRAGISAAMALKLAAAFETTPEFWVGLQTSYDLATAKRDKKRARITAFKPRP